MSEQKGDSAIPQNQYNVMNPDGTLNSARLEALSRAFEVAEELTKQNGAMDSSLLSNLG